MNYCRTRDFKVPIIVGNRTYCTGEEIFTVVENDPYNGRMKANLGGVIASGYDSDLNSFSDNQIMSQIFNMIWRKDIIYETYYFFKTNNLERFLDYIPSPIDINNTNLTYSYKFILELIEEDKNLYIKILEYDTSIKLICIKILKDMTSNLMLCLIPKKDLYLTVNNLDHLNCLEFLKAYGGRMLRNYINV